MMSFSLQESNADLPSEYWQIQKLVKYLKVCIVPYGIFLWLWSYSFVAIRLLFRVLRSKAKYNYILTFFQVIVTIKPLLLSVKQLLLKVF